MDDQKFLSNDAGKWQRIKAFYEDIIQLFVKFGQDFLAERIISGHRPALVIASKQDDFVRKVDLESKKGEDDLDAEHTAIDIVAHKDQSELQLALLSSYQAIEHVNHVIELPVDVSDDRVRLGSLIDFSKVGLPAKQLHGLDCDFVCMLLVYSTLFLEVGHQGAPVRHFATAVVGGGGSGRKEDLLAERPVGWHRNRSDFALLVRISFFCLLSLHFFY